jgi:amino acid permease
MFAIGTALIILIVQVAALTNLLQNEVKPILHSTTDTVNTLKGTVKFLSNNVSEPVIKLNQSLASLNRVLELLKLRK